jgi:hypothetical protein
MQELNEFIKKNIDVILSLLLFAIILSIPWWIPRLIPAIRVDMLITTISPIAAAVGVLIAYRINEKLRNPKLRIVSWNFFKYSNSIRVYVEIENSPGREIAKDARPLIIIKKIKDDEEHDLETSDLISREELRRGNVEHILLVPSESPRVEGEYIPWMVPELPYQSTGLYGIIFKHVTNIAPGQRTRAAILDVIKNEKGEYCLIIFSEYGTESERSVRILRCALRPGRYRFYLSISADKTYPAKGLFEVDTIEKNRIDFIKPSRIYRSLNLRELLP